MTSKTGRRVGRPKGTNNTEKNTINLLPEIWEWLRNEKKTKGNSHSKTITMALNEYRARRDGRSWK